MTIKLNPMKVACLFGSESDGPYAQELKASLEMVKAIPSIYYLSAHRTADRLREFMFYQAGHFDLLVGGAGLAAHLAGSMAAQTLLPIIGLPLPNAFSGLDSFLSTVQMPKGIPVACTPVGKVQNIQAIIQKISGLGETYALNFGTNSIGKELVEQNKVLIQKLGLEIYFEPPTPDLFQMSFWDIDHEFTNENLTSDLIIPVSTRETSVEDALRFFKGQEKSQTSLFTGLNRLDNGLLFFTQLKKDWREKNFNILKDQKKGQYK